MIEKTALEILRHYERMNRAVGRDRDAAVKLLRVREATNAKNAGRPDVTLEVCWSPSPRVTFTNSWLLLDYGVD